MAKTERPEHQNRRSDVRVLFTGNVNKWINKLKIVVRENYYENLARWVMSNRKRSVILYLLAKRKHKELNFFTIRTEAWQLPMRVK